MPAQSGGTDEQHRQIQDTYQQRRMLGCSYRTRERPDDTDGRELLRRMSDVFEEFKTLELDSKELTQEVIARKRAREFTDVTAKDIINGRYEHIVFLGKG